MLQPSAVYYSITTLPYQEHTYACLYLLQAVISPHTMSPLNALLCWSPSIDSATVVSPNFCVWLLAMLIKPNLRIIHITMHAQTTYI